MKRTLLALALLAVTSTTQADNFFGSNNGEWKMGPYGPYYEESNWPEWTPMYWMEEMFDSFDNNDNGFNGNRFNMPFFGNNGFNNGFGNGFGNGYSMPFNGPMMNMGMPNWGYNSQPYYQPYPVAPMNMQPQLPMQQPLAIPPAPTLAPIAPIVPAPAVGTPGPAKQ
ncbi:MAG: hypothetical protein WAQ53_14525 [Thiofilum sp.]|uniref:hypothetical protein n=1 Tax=Thiofilum sp. TaxID=2212733 RepID=UPI0025CBA4CF|nr:hypothetical protein [Thiofilum sp.]MBK8453562.1 hypothetical protein [Thiofilum sp.]